MIYKYNKDKRRLNNKKATSAKYLLAETKKRKIEGIKKQLYLTTAIDLLFQLGFINEDSVLAGKQYALIKYKRPVGGPSQTQSNLDAQLLPKTKQKQTWTDAIVHDELEAIWTESEKIIKKGGSKRLERIIIDNSFAEAANISNDKAELKKLKRILGDLAVLYKNHRSTKFLLNEIT